MKYQNAAELLPKHLLLEVQKYLSGEIVYIPKYEKRKAWGQNTGARGYYKERNKEIVSQYAEGKSIEELAETYGLAFETIKKIIYTK